MRKGEGLCEAMCDSVLCHAPSKQLCEPLMTFALHEQLIAAASKLLP